MFSVDLAETRRKETAIPRGSPFRELEGSAECH